MSNSPHPNGSPDDDALSDIPLARRQPTEISLDEIERASTAMQPQPKRDKTWLTIGLLSMAALAGLVAWQWPQLSPRLEGMKAAIATGKLRPTQNTPSDDSEALVSNTQSADPSDLTAAPTVDPAAAPVVTLTPENPTPENSTSSDEPPNTLLNHHRYEEAPQSELVLLNSKSTLKLRPAAQAGVTAMIAKAKSEGVQLGVVSGFRTIEDQDYLYFKVKAERGQSAKTRAEVSAPPGYSEHHTGYAVDIIDESRPETNVEESFETTLAYQWLEKNAAFFNFEMSFPKDNESAVSYEPWHWRYVGDQDSLETFYAP